MPEGIIRDGYSTPFLSLKMCWEMIWPLGVSSPAGGNKESPKPQSAPHCSHGEIWPRRVPHVNENTTAGDRGGPRPSATTATCAACSHSTTFSFKVCFPGPEHQPARSPGIVLYPAPRLGWVATSFHNFQVYVLTRTAFGVITVIFKSI